MSASEDSRTARHRGGLIGLAGHVSHHLAVERFWRIDLHTTPLNGFERH